ncbi:hypothetical protein [Amycolatopsis sp. NPDC098790]|uniref:hypothetical protein n=1 Tax=Amycolatopsis sp. NPDC098790 TaxID=3363939 RepID=UPI003829F8C0
MSIKIRTRAPRARCHQCGSAEIVALCHHCGRPLCQKHLTAAKVTSEFDGMELQSATPKHCKTHDHVVKPSILKYVIAAAAIAVLGVLVAFASVIPGLILILLGGAAGAAGWFEEQRRTRVAFENRPKVPVVPSIDSVEVREVVQGRLTLDDHGTYSSSVSPVAGSIDVAMTFSRSDQDRVRDYRGKFKLGPEHDVQFSAGYAVLLGRAGVEFTDGASTPPVLPLQGAVSDHPFLATPESRAGAKWQHHLEHRLTAREEVDAIPLWLTPSLVPESDQRALQLDLQWRGNWPSEETNLKARMVERLRLYVPASWGSVESVSKSPTIGGQADPVTGGRLIEWKQLSLSKAENHRLVLAVRFEEKIQLTDTITGSLTVSFDGALSGLDNVRFYHPLGDPREKEQQKNVVVKTEVTADLSLSLSGLRYQDVRVVPDLKKDSPEEYPESREFLDVVPDHDTLIALTNAMSKSGYYVKWVIGHPPSGHHDGSFNRAWDIGGRIYEGVFPVDFYVGLTGEEMHGVDHHAMAGNSRVRLSVKGAFTSTVMEERIKAVWYGLNEIVGDTLKQRGKPGSNGHTGTHRRRTARPGPDRGTDAREGLQRRRNENRAAVRSGAISEQLYREFEAELDREAAELDRLDDQWNEED